MIQNFFPEIFAADVLKERDKLMIAAKHCTREYEGEIKKKGDRVRILTVGGVASYDYSRNADINAPDVLTDEAQYLDIDKAKYEHVFLDAVDNVQSTEKLLTEAKRQMALKMADDVDNQIYSLYGDAGGTVDAYTVAITSANVINYLATVRQKFREANVPGSETIYLEVAPAVYTKFVLARIARETMNTKTLESGDTSSLYGIEISESNNIVLNVDRYKCFARTKGAIAYASQLTETKQYEPERRFGDAIKSLQVWGSKVIRPKEFFVFDAKIGAEV